MAHHLTEKIKTAHFRPKKVKKLVLLREMRVSQINEHIPGGLEIRYGDVVLMYHYLEGKYGVCTVAVGQSTGKRFLIPAGTIVGDYGEYYEALI